MASSSPTDKLKARGNVVAMTGDGTNDAPTLHKADIGLSTGSVPAKENSDIIIPDDNLTSVVKVVRWGLSICSNFQKLVQFQLIVIVTALTFNFGAACLTGEVPSTAVQLLWVNLIMGILGAFALAIKLLIDDLTDKTPLVRTLTQSIGICLLGIFTEVQAVGANFDQNHTDSAMPTAMPTTIVKKSSWADHDIFTVVIAASALIVTVLGWNLCTCWKQRKESQTEKERTDREEERHVEIGDLLRCQNVMLRFKLRYDRLSAAGARNEANRTAYEAVDSALDVEMGWTHDGIYPGVPFNGKEYERRLPESLGAGDDSDAKSTVDGSMDSGDLARVRPMSTRFHEGAMSREGGVPSSSHVENIENIGPPDV